MTPAVLFEVLCKFIPPKAAELVVPIILQYKIVLNIKRPRNSILGDYRPPVFNGKHEISVNKDLNKYAFLITLIHEIAHLVCWEKYKNRIEPHGMEWKNEYKWLMMPYLKCEIFPLELRNYLTKHFINPKASSCSDTQLQKLLRNFDVIKIPILDEVKMGEKFELKNGMQFIKGEKMRKRYKCKEINTGKLYFVNEMAEIVSAKI